MDKHVFISYKHDDSEFAENLIHRVEKEGFTIWLDNESLHPGDDWREGIDQAIRSSFALIVIMSPDAKASEYVTYEWSFAWGCGIKVIPVMYRKTNLHPRLGSLQYLDFTNRIRPWDDLMKALKTAESKTLKALQVVASQPVPSLLPVVPIISIEQRVQEWIDKGNLFLKRKDYDGALDAFAQAIQLDPENASARAGKGDVLLKLKSYQEALDAFRQAILLEPDNAYAYAGKSHALCRFGKYKEALVASEQAIRLDRDLPHAWDNKGIVLRALKRYEEALSACDESLQLAPENVSAWIGKGITLKALKRYEEALLAYDEGLRLDPDHVTIWNNKGNVLYDLKRYKEALSAYEKALRLDPDHVLAWYNKGHALKALGRSQEAEQCYKKARDLGYEGQGNSNHAK